jgi:hypothetical protein
MMGGMWGCRKGVLSCMGSEIEKYNHFHKYGSDQKFLARQIYPRIKKNAYISSNVVRMVGEDVHPIQIERDGLEFIGKANRDEVEDIQNRLFRDWMAKGSPMKTVPNIYTPSGRFWLLMRILKRKFSC